MPRLNTEPNVVDPDGIFATLMEAYNGLSEVETNDFNTRLILLLINHIGDDDVIHEAIQLSRQE